MAIFVIAMMTLVMHSSISQPLVFVNVVPRLQNYNKPCMLLKVSHVSPQLQMLKNGNELYIIFLFFSTSFNFST